MNINWKVRIKSRTFWVAFVPSLLLLVQVVADVFGYKLNLEPLGEKLLAVINVLFCLLTIMGVVTDHTTTGVSDSKQALTYEEPSKDT